MAPESFNVITRTPIPASLPPATVLAALHTFEALITPNPYLDHFEPRVLTSDETAGADPFFFPRASGLYGYVIYDRVPVIPGLGSWAALKVAVPCVFQRFEHGVRCCAHAQGGVVVRSSYEVRRRGEVTAQGVDAWVGEGGSGPAGHDDGQYELVDISNVECGALVKPFVKMRFSSAHQALLEKVIQNLLKGGGQAGGGTW
ncbi:uncharacterized protein C8A04DRAFT_25465 [Dichotomopilus funicola]|uniref:DUF7053 domain-containing protein n=1 Tax=Dichotomopilus funicola TaxID=1934379 RepID=A0AAN6V856_9PEZI|nr:hypothetical protein C8A04DRAFT_25465 [Dichotomopilus funicola]